jgi:hypothetical protein
VNIKFGTWNVRILYRAGSLKMEANELAKYNLGVSCDKGDNEPADNYIFFYDNRNANYHVGAGNQISS